MNMERPKSSQNAENVLSSDGSMTSVAGCSEEDPSLRPYLTVRERLRNLLHSHKFQVAVISLVIIDCLLVIAELLLDLRILELQSSGGGSDLNDHPAPHVLHYMSIAILSIFIVEITAKIYALGLEFFHHKLEVFDAFVVFLSFSLDVAFRDEETITNAFGLVIVLRLWRVARILNGIVMSVKTQTEHKLMKERRLREETEQEMQKCRDYTDALENEVVVLRQLLQKHGIKEIPPSVVEANATQSTIRVVAEVNHEHSNENA